MEFKPGDIVLFKTCHIKLIVSEVIDIMVGGKKVIRCMWYNTSTDRFDVQEFSSTSLEIFKESTVTV